MSDDLKELKTNVNQFFLIVIGCMIFFMQSGFAFLEAGSVRSKNTTNILIKNTLDIFAGAVVYWLFGYAFAYGGDGDQIEGRGDSFIGHENFALSGVDDTDYAKWFFQFVFAASASTIVSGSIAERTEFIAYLVYSVFITGFIYPVVTHWAWSDYGWLTNALKDDGVIYQDFAGSGVVHMVGGMLAFVGAAIVGPRLGRFDRGKAEVIQGHTVPLISLGGFILFFGFLAFNGGSQGSIIKPGDGATVSLVIVNTVLAGAGGAIIALVIKRIMTGLFNGHWSLLITINGGLTGMVGTLSLHSLNLRFRKRSMDAILNVVFDDFMESGTIPTTKVSICAGCNVVHPWAAFIIGLIGGIAYMMWSYLMVRVKVDDPIDAVAVHFGGGLWGIVAVTLFKKDAGVLYEWDKEAFQSFGWNILGGLVISAWSAFWGIIIFGSLKALGILRVPRELELRGLDIPKHGEPAYPVGSYGDGWGGQSRETTGHPVVVLHNNFANVAPANIEMDSNSQTATFAK